MVKSAYRSELITWLQLLAQPAALQAQYVLDRGFHPDELALELLDLVLLAPGKVAAGEISVAECECVIRLSRAFDQFGGEHNAELWTIEALGTANVWAGIRVLAADCLRVFDQASGIEPGQRPR